MVRSVQLYVPSALVKLVTNTLKQNEFVHRMNSIACQGGKEVQINFLCEDKYLTDILKSMEPTGLGLEYGSVNIVALESTIPSLSSGGSGKLRKYKLDERRTVREIEENINSGIHCTVDYVLMIFVASLISTVGLVSDSPVTVVASMLVSPLMGPIVAMAYGLSTQQYGMVLHGARTEFIGFLVCYGVGLIAGCMTVLFFKPLGLPNLIRLTGNVSLESEQMLSRGEVINLLGGFWNAVPSGIGVALATTNAGISALVGVAISAALLPPLVNSALLVAMGIIYEAAGVDHGNESDKQLLNMGFVSFILFLINLVTIVLMAWLTFRIKGVTGENIEMSNATRASLARKLMRTPKHLQNLYKSGPKRGADLETAVAPYTARASSDLAGLEEGQRSFAYDDYSPKSAKAQPLSPIDVL